MLPMCRFNLTYVHNVLRHNTNKRHNLERPPNINNLPQVKISHIPQHKIEHRSKNNIHTNLCNNTVAYI